eukprot:gene10872-16994_t
MDHRVLSGRSAGVGPQSLGPYRHGRPIFRRASSFQPPRARRRVREVVEEEKVEEIKPEEIEPVYLPAAPAIILGKRNDDGTPLIRVVDERDINIELAGPYVPEIGSEELLPEVHKLDTEYPEEAQEKSMEVPGIRSVTDPEELNLVGDGLPIIFGPEFPEVYWAAIESMAKGRDVALPRPHPKFTLSDMERIATSEPNWLQVEQKGFFHLFQGLRERNWTDKRNYDRNAERWRLQFFQVVTTCADGSQFWVDLPSPGDPVPFNEQGIPDPTQVGYNSIFQQLYQAYEQRAVQENQNIQRLSKRDQRIVEYLGYLPEGEYNCPAEKLLDVSYHWTSNSVKSPMARFLMNPQLSTMTMMIRHGIDESGILEAKLFRNEMWNVFGPTLPRFEWTFDPNNAGPLYFLACLTLGVVIPAMRRSNILDIETLEDDPGAAQDATVPQGPVDLQVSVQRLVIVLSFKLADGCWHCGPEFTEGIVVPSWLLALASSAGTLLAKASRTTRAKNSGGIFVDELLRWSKRAEE